MVNYRPRFYEGVRWFQKYRLSETNLIVLGKTRKFAEDDDTLIMLSQISIHIAYFSSNNR